MMKLLLLLIRAAVLLCLGCEAEERFVTSKASRNNHILLEQVIVPLRESFSITSNVPVTILQTEGGDQYWSGGCQSYALHPGEVTTLVSSDCAPDETSVVPKISLGESDRWGQIKVDAILVTLDDVPSSMDFLEPSTFEIMWSYIGDCSANDDLTTNGAICPRSFVFAVLFALVRRAAVAALTTTQQSYQRALETETECTYNVEVFMNGCEHTVNVTAPSARTADATLNVREGADAISTTQKECRYTANFTFPEDQITDLGEVSGAVTSGENGGQCGLICVGRPYVDASGSSLHAMPLLDMGGECSWTGERLLSGDIDPMEELATEDTLSLGEEWTNNALGEHASVASFAVFAIALMTNGGPVSLVEAALKAGLDEVRHAKVSFAIASKLSGNGQLMEGKSIHPGPLPESNHVFQHNLTELALAVAKEGCIDETMSAFAAAVEVEHITKVLKIGTDGTKYFNVSHSTLTWIRDELYNIALDESNHSALAWRTMSWVCWVAPDACRVVNDTVFEEKRLEISFQRRFASIGLDDESLEKLRAIWRKIYSAHKSFEVNSSSACSIDEAEARNADATTSLMAHLSENILNSILCDVTIGRM